MSMMHHYAVYDLATGAILGAGSSTNERIVDLARKSLKAGQGLYEGRVDPVREYIPNGTPTPRLEPQEVVDAAAVKEWAGRLLRYTDWYVTRQQETGADIPAAVLAYRQAVRDASGAIEAMDPIPADYRDPKYWPAQP
jgi:hypothetical protein